MTVCPLEFRYGRDEMKAIFSEESRLSKYLEVEAAIAEGHAVFGNISKKDAEAIGKAATLKTVKLERVREIENDIKHDIMAVVKALSEVCGTSGRFVHMGVTSNDIIDTAVALQLKEASHIMEDDIIKLRGTLLNLAKRHKRTAMVGRTHGQHAIPMTFGLKMAVYTMETHRHLERLRECKGRLLVGKISGAVGTGAGLGEKALGIQDAVLKSLGLGVEEASSQVVGRDRYIEFVCLLANICTSMEKFATEVRNLQRTEIGEVSEAFDVMRQVGSSTMAHKQNPISAENICGLARTVRGFVTPVFENNILWHERDLTNSSVERFIIPHICILTDDILTKTDSLFKSLNVRTDRMRENLGMQHGLIMAESIMLLLTGKGMNRQEAHEVTRKASMMALREKESLGKALKRDRFVRKYVSEKEIDAALKPENYLGSSEKIVELVGKLIGE